MNTTKKKKKYAHPNGRQMLAAVTHLIIV